MHSRPYFAARFKREMSARRGNTIPLYLLSLLSQVV
jgi:hypothetical protein